MSNERSVKVDEYLETSFTENGMCIKFRDSKGVIRHSNPDCEYRD